MKKYKCTIFFLVFLGLAGTAWSQSFYSQSGVGLTRHFISGQATGMGGTGLAVFDPLSVSYLNPASLTNLQITYISGNFKHTVNSLSGTPNSAVISNTNVEGVLFHVPIIRGKLSTALGLNPYSSIEYRFEENSPGLQHSFEGAGGVNIFFSSLAFRPIPRLSIGLSGLFYFGQLRKVDRINYSSSSSLYANTFHEISETFTAVNFRLGILGKLTRDWSIAAILTPGKNITVDKNVLQGAFVDTAKVGARDIELPLGYGVGTTFFVTPKFMFNFDYTVEKWSGTNTEGYTGDGFRFGGGVEYSGRGKILGDSYFSRMAFRAGFYYRALGLEQPVGKQVSEVFGTLGVGMPIKWSAARLDFAFELGRRGDLGSNPISENIVQFSAAITTGERWFHRGKSR